MLPKRARISHGIILSSDKIAAEIKKANPYLHDKLHISPKQLVRKVKKDRFRSLVRL